MKTKASRGKPKTKTVSRTIPRSKKVAEIKGQGRLMPTEERLASKRRKFHLDNTIDNLPILKIKIMDDITVSRDYRTMFREAEKANNYVRMKEVFVLLCDELGIPDPERERISESAAKSAAERKNAMETGEIKRRP